MDKFTQDAFQKAEKEMVEIESTAWEKATSDKAEVAKLQLAALAMAGAKEMAEIITFCNENGLTEALHKYSIYSAMSGFKMGFNAGRESMLGQL